MHFIGRSFVTLKLMKEMHMKFTIFFLALFSITVDIQLAHAASDKVLCDFEESAKGWAGGQLVKKHATVGEGAYLIPIGKKSTYTCSGDWSAYRHFKIDVINPGMVLLANFRFFDTAGRQIMSFEYNVYSGRTTQHIRVDGLRNNFGIGEGIDTKNMAKLEITLKNRHQHDKSKDGIYLDNIRLSTRPTEAFRDYVDGKPVGDIKMELPDGFLLPEFPGMEAGYHTWALDPNRFQLLCRPGTGRDGKGRALEMKPLAVNKIKFWDGVRKFPKDGTYVLSFWAKGALGSSIVDLSFQKKAFKLSPEWKHCTYEFNKKAGSTRRFVLEAQNMSGKSVFVDDLVVYLKGGKGSLEPVSKVEQKPSVVTWADGIIYINGKATFMLGFHRGNPDVFRDSPFNLCLPHELLQPDMSFLDKCAKYGLYTTVNLTAPMRAIAPESAGRFAEKYKNHPALFSYYLCDEPDHSSPSAVSEPTVLARATEILHELDPNHPTSALVIPWCASNMYRYRDAVDVLSADRYAVEGTANNKNLWTVWRSNEAMRRSGTEGQPNIFTPKSPGNITREENWSQAYMCIVAGAAGITWFHYDMAKPKWDDFVELGKELREIEEYLVGVELERGLKIEGKNGVRAIGRAGKENTALIAVNIKPNQANNVKITAPFLAHAKTATVMFENRSVPVKDGVIIDSFKGLERHVYIVDGLPKGVKQRKPPRPGDPTVTDAGAAWRVDIQASFAGRSADDVKRDKDMQTQISKAEAALENGDRDTAKKIYEALLKKYPDAQDIRERIRSM